MSQRKQSSDESERGAKLLALERSPKVFPFERSAEFLAFEGFFEFYGPNESTNKL